jgi:hypothetical protein
LVYALALDGACLGDCVAALGGCGGESETYSVESTSKCLSATGIRVNWFEGAGEVDPFPTSGGSPVAFGAYKVTVRFGMTRPKPRRWRRGSNSTSIRTPSRDASTGS